MKYTSQSFYIAILLLICFNYQNTFSQDIARSVVAKPSSKSYSMFNKVIIENAILEDGKYTYKFNDKNILIEINDGYYYEYHPNNQYIKAKINWITEFKYKLTIVDFELRAFNLKIGSNLITKIDKKKGDEYFYTSQLNQKTTKGSFKKVN